MFISVANWHDHGVKSHNMYVVDKLFSMQGTFGSFNQEMLLIHQRRAKLNRQFGTIFKKLFAL